MRLFSTNKGAASTTHYRSRCGLFGYQHRRSCVISLKRLYQRPVASLLTVLLIGIALALPALLSILVHNSGTLSTNWDNRAQMLLYLSSNTNDARADHIMVQLKSQPHVTQMRYISAAAGLADFEKNMKISHVLQALPANPLPGVIAVSLDSRDLSQAALKRLRQRASGLPGVDKVGLDLDWIMRLQAITQGIKRLIDTLALLFAVLVLLVIGNSISLATQYRAEEIHVARLIGATSGFIRRPFLYTGFFYGLFGAIISCFIISLAIAWLSTPIAQLSAAYHSHFALQGLSFGKISQLLSLGGVLGIIGAWVAVDLQIKRIEKA